MECGNRNERIANMCFSCFQNADMDVGILRQAGSNCKSSRTSSHDDEIKVLFEEIVKGAESWKIIFFGHVEL